MILGGVGRRKWSEKGRCNYILIKIKLHYLKNMIYNKILRLSKAYVNFKS